MYTYAGQPGIASVGSLYLPDNVRYGVFRSGVSPTGTYMIADGTAPDYTPGRVQAVVEFRLDKINGER